MQPSLVFPCGPQAHQMPSRTLTPQEQVMMAQIAAHIEYLEGQAILIERMSAAIDRHHGVSVRDDLTVAEIDAFTTVWSSEVLDTCLLAGVTSWEVRKALRTGVLPDKGIVESLAGFRAPIAPDSET